MDFDCKKKTNPPLDELYNLIKTSVLKKLDEIGISYITEFSGRRGIHVWIIFEEKISKKIGYSIIQELVKDLSFDESKFGLDLEYINSNKDDVYEVYADDSEMFDSMEFSIKNTNIRMIYGIDACRWFDVVLDENNSCAEPIYYLNIDTEDADYNELAKALFMCFPNWTFPDSEIYVEFLVTPLELTEADKTAFNKIYNTVEDKSVGFVCFAKDDTFYSFNKANSIIKES